ncbi:MarR family transcriptional regulator [Neisseria meningitidis]|nr:MarR family transcriptional regulator [Neisseria meningitidis]OUC19679.1 MarR family transcriptional regulator [Neisseria meningitidis]
MNQRIRDSTRINLICNVFDKWIGQQDLNYNLFAVLYTLATEGSRTQKHIGEKWSLPKQTVSGVCKTLAGQGLIEWQESEQDRRERLLSLTEKGKAHAAPLTESAQEFSDKETFAKFPKIP